MICTPKQDYKKFSDDGLGRGREGWLSACLLFYVGRDILNYTAAMHEVPPVGFYSVAVRSRFCSICMTSNKFCYTVYVSVLSAYLICISKRDLTGFSKKGLTSAEDSAIMIYGRCFVQGNTLRLNLISTEKTVVECLHHSSAVLFSFKRASRVLSPL